MKNIIVKISILLVVLFFVGLTAYYLKPYSKTYQINQQENSQEENEIRPYNNYPKYGHAEDFSWISGKLDYENIEGGCWTLRFEESKQVQTEKYNGVFALEINETLRNEIKDNEFVVVEGELNGTKYSMNCPPNIYKVRTLNKN